MEEKKTELVLCKSDETVVISDLHAGSRGFQAEKFAKFVNRLIQHPPYRLIIAGDAFELWSTNYKNIGPEEHRALRKIFELSEKGTKIVYIPGNHDRAFRAFSRFTFGKIKIRYEYVIRTHRKKYVVLHGDEFDAFTRNHVVMSILLDQVYVALVKLNTLFRRFFGRRKSLASEKHSKSYAEVVEKIRNLALHYARSRKADGVIIGHSHWPELLIEPDGVIYANSGDWIESCTYVVVGDRVQLRQFEEC